MSDDRDEHDGGMRIPPDRDSERTREGLHDAPGHAAESGTGPDLGIDDPSKIEVEPED